MYSLFGGVTSLRAVLLHGKVNCQNYFDHTAIVVVMVVAVL
jgi:hypothetical protein